MKFATPALLAVLLPAAAADDHVVRKRARRTALGRATARRAKEEKVALSMPDLTEAGFTADLSMPAAAVLPELRMADMSMPELTPAEMSIPAAAVLPELRMAEMSMPDLTPAEMSFPAAAVLPELRMADMSMPDLTPAEMSLPDVLPQLRMAPLSLPDLTTAEWGDMSMPTEEIRHLTEMSLPLTTAEMSLPDVLPELRMAPMSLPDLTVAEMSLPGLVPELRMADLSVPLTESEWTGDLSMPSSADGSRRRALRGVATN